MRKKIIVKLFASSWYIFLTYMYDARSHLHQTWIQSAYESFMTK